LPALRDRFEDIPFLADMFLDFCCRKHKLALKRLSQRALNQLMAYDWPGNVRELENVIEKSVIFLEDTTIQSIELNSESSFPHQMEYDSTIREDLTFSELKDRVVSEMERKYLTDLLKRFRGNVSQAIKYSKIDRKNFYNKMKKYQINPHSFKEVSSE
jgi:two-component system response regulator AtoC